MATLALETVDSAFGPTADLYRDVLGVKPNASKEQIQNAYFERRNSLFQVLAELEAATELDGAKADERFRAEREMDAVVITLRILGDPVSRAQYDDIRVERIERDSATDTDVVEPDHAVRFTMDESDDPGNENPKSVLKRSTYHISVIDNAFEESTTATDVESGVTAMEASPERKSNLSFGPGTNNRGKRNAKRKARRVSPDLPRNETGSTRRKKKQNLNESMVSTVVDESDIGSVSEGSFRTLRTMETSLTAYEQNRGCLQTMQDEILGALDDTGRSIHQVFSVFTLRESEIDAVAGRIDKARRQMVHSFKK